MSKSHEIKNDIWNFLLSKGFTVSRHSNKILHSPNPLEEMKYAFGKINLKKWSHGIKRYSIPFSRLEVKDGKIQIKPKKIKVQETEIEVK